MHGYIEFSKYKLIDMEDINNIYYCFELDKKKCKEASVCFYSKDNKWGGQLPTLRGGVGGRR